MDSIVLDNRDVQAAHEVLKYLKERSSGGIAHYSVVDVDYKVVKLDNTACVAQLLHYSLNGRRGTPRLCVYYLPTKRDDWADLDPNRVKFLDYLVNRSFAKDCYVMNHYFNPTKNQCLVTRCDVPNNLFGFANNILRIGIENNTMLESWVRLVDGGVNEDLAFLMCQYTESTVNNGVVEFLGQTSWYHSVMSNNSRTTFAGILKGNKAIIKTFGKETYQDNPTYEVRDILSGGKNFLSVLTEEVYSTKTTTEPVLDLMGSVVERGRESQEFLLNDLNTYWESYDED